MNNFSYNNVMNLNKKAISRIKSLLLITSSETRLKIMFFMLDDNLCKCKCGAKNCNECKCLSCMVERSVNEIVNNIGESQSLVSHQLKVLKKANLVKTRKEGKNVYYSLKDGHIKSLLNIAIEHVEENK